MYSTGISYVRTIFYQETVSKILLRVRAIRSQFLLTYFFDVVNYSPMLI